MDKYLQGNAQYRQDVYPSQKELMDQLVEKGQHPDALVIDCSDSRYDPNEVLSAKPGDLFGERHVAALVPPYDPKNEGPVHAALSYGINHLGVSNIVVMGHTKCGGVAALVDLVENGVENPDSPEGRWVNKARSVVEQVMASAEFNIKPRAELLKEVEQSLIRWSVENLKTYPVVNQALEAGKIKLHAWQFDITDGSVNVWNGSSFEPAADMTKKPAAARPTRPGAQHSCC